MYIGIDIGGTKCAVTKARVQDDGKIEFLSKVRFETLGVNETLERIFAEVEKLMPAEAIGISCGGPLDDGRGVIMSPPNLYGWDNVPIVDMLTERFAVPAGLLNDANASALAEWHFGAGRGCRNMVFLTFGTGLGAGIIIDGKLYSGTNGNAGEVGHIRLAPDGPLGFGKLGSFEGFCSGGGLARLAKIHKERAAREGREIFAGDPDAKTLAALARSGDPDALAVFEESAKKLGFGLSFIIDVLNPERIVLGSVFKRAEDLFRPVMEDVLRNETLSESLSVCKVVPAELDEELGDYAAISVAISQKQVKKGEKEMKYTNELCERYPVLLSVKEDVFAVVNAVAESYLAGGKILLVGNGGSAADCEHISGELLKGFLMKREPQNDELAKLSHELGDAARKLERGVPAIPLTSLSASITAFANDVDPELAFAQLVYALGGQSDVLIAISTSGNSKNAVAAAKCARALGIKTVALTGADGGALSEICDICVKAPATETYKVQEYHLPIYHAICADVENILFKNDK